MDDISLKILAILQKKARIPNVEVARQVGMAPSAVLERIRKLEKQGIIDGYEVRLNPRRFDRGLMAFVQVSVRSGPHVMQVGETLGAIPDIQEVHYVAGDDGYVIKVRVAGTAELDRLIREKVQPIQGVRSTRTQVVLSSVKESSRIPIDQTLSTGKDAATND